MTIDVVIAGGGPNGLLLACELALTGVRPTVLEREPLRPTMPKANGLVGRVVQALDYRGLYPLLSGNSGPPMKMPAFQFGALPLALSMLDNHSLYALPIPQRRLEELLEERARELGIEIQRGHEVVGVNQTDELVNIEVSGPDGHYELDARYLVAADGGRSAIRKACGIDFPGITERGFVGRGGQVNILPPVAQPGTGELEVAGVGRFRPATFTRTERGMFAFGMFQPGLYRVAVYESADEELEDNDEMPLAELQAAINRVLGGEVPLREPIGGEPSALRRTTGANSRQAEHYRHGRVFLVGDAAHVHSGVGGPGLNLGMQDVLNLGWKLAGTINGWAPADLLDSYQSERHPVGERVIMHTRAQTALISAGPLITAVRQVFEELLQDKNNVPYIADLMAGADIHYPVRGTGPAHPLAGGWMPDLALHNDSGSTRVAELLRAGRPVLLNLAGETDLVDAAKGWSDRVDVVSASTAQPPADAVLIRPDGYVAWATESADSTDDLRAALSAWFGAPA
jgi:2-polyprenyl-6-methoxyphenol hydroxylase-like FAD-dependent oxidoreductase